jgi:Zn-dependent protease
MRRRKYTVSAGAALLLAALYLLLDWDMLLILLVPAAVHELGHLAALRALGARVRRVSLSVSGVCMYYTGAPGPGGRFIAAAAGPAAGLLFALASAFLGGRLGSAVLMKCAGVSALLSAFNLLPSLPLDGGRMLSALISRGDGAGDVMETAGLAAGMALLFAGLLLACRGRGMGLECAGIWLLLSQPGIVKRRGVL